MRLKVWLCSIVCLANLSVSLAYASQEPTIRFGINASPPFHITTDIQQELNIPAGFCDELVDSVKRNVADVDIEISRLPHIRIRRLMKRQENLCFPCLIRRSSYNPDYYFSETINLYQPHGIITRSELAQKLIKQYGSPISFQQLAAETELRFAQPTGRKYGDIQPILDDYLIDSPKHRTIFGQNALFNLLTMIVSDRVDYTLDYQLMINFYNNLSPADKQNSLAFIPITEYGQRPVTGAIGCARNAWGKRAIEHINSNIDAITKDPKLLESLDYWLGTDRLLVDKDE
ncbi:MAG: hypothetical protein ACQEQ8_04900 [Pseudomonadota bacterium]